MTQPTNPVFGRMKSLTVGAAALGLLFGSALSAAGLKDEPEVFARLLTTAIASEIRDNCDTIKARNWRATSYVLGIVSYARKQGFSMAEIEAYKNDPSEQARLRREGYAYLDTHGVDRAKATGYCALGTTEIANQSQIGRLIKSR
jgi:hypothetical protein